MLGYLISFHGKRINSAPVEGMTLLAAVTGRSSGNASKSHFPITVNLVITLLKYPCGTGYKPPCYLDRRQPQGNRNKVWISLVRQSCYSFRLCAHIINLE